MRSSKVNQVKRTVKNDAKCRKCVHKQERDLKCKILYAVDELRNILPRTERTDKMTCSEVLSLTQKYIAHLRNRRAAMLGSNVKHGIISGHLQSSVWIKNEDLDLKTQLEILLNAKELILQFQREFDTEVENITHRFEAFGSNSGTSRTNEEGVNIVTDQTVQKPDSVGYRMTRPVPEFFFIGKNGMCQRIQVPSVTYNRTI